MKGREGWILLLIFLLLLVPPIVVIVAEVSRDTSYSDITKYHISGKEKPIRFHVVGDFGNLKSEVVINHTEPVSLVAHAMKRQAKERPIDFIISSGDNSYPTAYANFDQHIYKLMYKVFQEEGIKAKPWYLVLGNHDCYDDPDYEVHAHKLYPMWHMPHKYYEMVVELNDGYKAGFVFLYGCSLTGEGVDYKNSSAVDQYSWLNSVLEKYSKDKSIIWKVVTIHMPLWSVGGGHGDSDFLKQYLYPILFQYNVDLVICGHEHIMAHMVSRIFNGQPQAFQPSPPRGDCNNGTYYPYSHASDWIQGQAIHEIVQGASGRELYDICPNRVTTMADLLFSASQYGFSEVYIDSTSIEINYFNLTDELPIFTTRILRK